MNDVLRSILNWVGVYLGLIVVFIFLVNLYMHGFLIKYARVKASRGRLVMVEVNTIVRRYLALGHIEDNFLVYKKRNSRDKCRMVVPSGAVYQDLGINWVTVDEAKNTVIMPDLTTVEGHDAETTESLYLRCLNKPSLLDNKTKVLLILVIIVLIAIFILGIFNFQIYKKVVALNKV